MKKTISQRATEAATRNVPLVGNEDAYRRSLDYFRLGFAKGFRAAERIAKRGNTRGVHK